MMAWLCMWMEASAVELLPDYPVLVFELSRQDNPKDNLELPLILCDYLGLFANCPKACEMITVIITVIITS